MSQTCLYVRNVCLLRFVCWITIIDKIITVWLTHPMLSKERYKVKNVAVVFLLFIWLVEMSVQYCYVLNTSQFSNLHWGFVFLFIPFIQMHLTVVTIGCIITFVNIYSWCPNYTNAELNFGCMSTNVFYYTYPICMIKYLRRNWTLFIFFLAGGGGGNQTKLKQWTSTSYYRSGNYINF